jgi:hypothetical protein
MLFGQGGHDVPEHSQPIFRCMHYFHVFMTNCYQYRALRHVSLVINIHLRETCKERFAHTCQISEVLLV